MKWSFILYLPVAVTLAWALAVLILKRRATRAQLILGLTMILTAFATTVLSVFFRGKAGSLFIYDFLFKCVAVFCVPMYYVGICALTEPRGVTLRQRRTFFVPILFVAGLTYCSFRIGPRHYELMCYALREGGASWMAGDPAWNLMYFWDYILFPVVMLISSAALMISAAGKMRVFGNRFNRFYAQNINVPRINSHRLLLFTLVLLILAFLVVFIIDFRPLYYKYHLIACALLMTMLQFHFGRFIYRMDFDARYLANLIKQHPKTDQQ